MQIRPAFIHPLPGAGTPFIPSTELEMPVSIPKRKIAHGSNNPCCPAGARKVIEKMQKTEFEKLTGAKVSEEDWKIIETVYNYHPVVPEVGGKEIIQQLFGIGGVHLLLEMKPTAVRIQELEKKHFELQAELNRTSDEMKSIRDCYPTRIFPK